MKDRVYLAVLGIVTVICGAWTLHDLNSRVGHLEHQPTPTITPQLSDHGCLPPLCRILTPKTSAHPPPRVTPTAASRSRRLATAPPARAGNGTGSQLDVTAYCWTGSPTASGTWPQIGDAAGNRWPFGTRLRVPGVGVVTIRDRIGHGSDLDIYLGHDGCDQRARTFGRRHLRIEVLP